MTLNTEELKDITAVGLALEHLNSRHVTPETHLGTLHVFSNDDDRDLGYFQADDNDEWQFNPLASRSTAEEDILKFLNEQVQKGNIPGGNAITPVGITSIDVRHSRGLYSGPTTIEGQIGVLFR